MLKYRCIFPTETHAKICPPNGGRLAFPICRKPFKPGCGLGMKLKKKKKNYKEDLLKIQLMITTPKGMMFIYI